tara:strand:- start:763 stop:1197 length:435 start_codon:yes stop_codon:yes gene_type:complete
MINPNIPEENKLVNQPDTKPPSSIMLGDDETPMTYLNLRDSMSKFFDEKEYECSRAFQEGLSIPVSEDYRNIDLINNLNDLVFNYCSNDSKMSPTDKLNFKNLCQGINLITLGLKQYDSNDVDRIFVAKLAGYITKVLRNFYHD